MNIEGNFSSLPDEILLMILDKAGFDPKHQLVEKKFQEVFNSIGFDQLFHSFEKSPLLRKILEKVEIEHPDYSSNFEKVKEVYKTIIQSTSKLDGGQEKNKQTRENYGTLSPERLEELEKWNQAVNFIKVWEIIRQNPELSSGHPTKLQEINDNIKQKDLFAQVNEIHTWMNKYTDIFDGIHLLNLSKLNLTTVPEELFNFKGLTIINLGDNNLTNIPPEIKNFPKLLLLNLENNQLTTLPPEIGNLSKLKVFHISGNPIKTLPNQIFDSVNPIISQNLDVLAIKKASL